MNRVERLVTALNIGGPICLALRYDHYPKCCVEASQAGAEALRRKGLKANAIQCILSVSNGGSQWWVGATSREAFDLMCEWAEPGPRPTYEEWAKSDAWPKEDPIHMVIEVEDRWLLDLTTGQVGFPHMPPSARVPIEHGWPVIGVGRGLDLRWAKLPHRELDDEAKAYRNEGLTLDMLDAMKLALRVELNPDRFRESFANLVRGH